MQCGAITIHQPVRTGLMEILMMTPEGKKPYSQTDLLVREPQTFSLMSQTQMKAVYFFLRVYCYFIATVSYRHFYSFSLLQRPALQKQILHLSPMTRRASR